MICNTCCSKRSSEKHNTKMCQKKQFKIICGNNRSCKYNRINQSEPQKNDKEESAEKINSHLIISKASGKIFILKSRESLDYVQSGNDRLPLAVEFKKYWYKINQYESYFGHFQTKVLHKNCHCAYFPLFIILLGYDPPAACIYKSVSQN